jgi:hypothetical protein
MASPLLMPVSCEIEGSVLMLRMVGTYSPADLRAAIGAALAEPHRPQLIGLIADLRYSEALATRTLGDSTAIIGFLAYHASSFGNRIALVAPEVGDDTLLRMASVDLRTGGVDAITFRDMGEARAWIRR